MMSTGSTLLLVKLLTHYVLSEPSRTHLSPVNQYDYIMLLNNNRINNTIADR